MVKGDDELITLQIKGDGPIGGLTVTADMNGHVKGYANVPDVILPANAQGKLDVGGAVGAGVLSVIRDMGLKDPYVGQTELQTGEIAEDLTYYFAVSEQVPSVVGLGVLMNRDKTVRQAGGFIVQLMPFAEEEVISRLEENIKNLSSVTAVSYTHLDVYKRQVVISWRRILPRSSSPILRAQDYMNSYPKCCRNSIACKKCGNGDPE